jgi:HSP90 family molecular chaperone
LCSRALAESSPYFEALKKKDVEVLFCYEPYDELVLMQLRQFDGRNLTSVEKEMRQDKESDDLTDLGEYWTVSATKLLKCLCIMTSVMHKFLIYLFTSALHVSGFLLAHPQR